MDVVGARGQLFPGIFSAVEACAGWVGVGAVCGDHGGDRDAGSGRPRRAGPQADSSPGWSPGSTLRSSPASLWPRVSSPGGPRHHDPEEQVEKIRWQHHLDKLHPQTGRRRTRGGGGGCGQAGEKARCAALGSASRALPPTSRSGGSPAGAARCRCVLLPQHPAPQVFAAGRLRAPLQVRACGRELLETWLRAGIPNLTEKCF